MMDKAYLEKQCAELEFCNLIGKVFGSGHGTGVKVRLWEERNFNKTFDTMTTRELKQGTVLLLDMRRQQIIEEVRKMEKKYTQEDLDKMSDAEICEIAVGLNIIDVDELNDEIQDSEPLMSSDEICAKAMEQEIIYRTDLIEDILTISE